MTDKEVRIAMWSGPRNISTALMRAFENRPDTAVIDEPFYAHYLYRTGADHPGIDEVIISQSTNWHTIVELITGPIPHERFIWYQKHMVHHVVDAGDLDWITGFRNCFLVRHPAEVINSYSRQNPIREIRDLGFIQQVELFNMIMEITEAVPIVVDSKDILTDPDKYLQLLCDRLGIVYSKQMLAWPAGSRDTDGVWAPFWYQNVEKSTGFIAYRKKNEPVPAEYRGFLEQCMPCYEYLSGFKL